MMMRPADFFVLRALSRRGGIVADAEELASLQRWRDNYGAAQVAADGLWRLCYRPQWIGDAKLRMTDAVVARQTASTNDDAASLPPPVFVFAEHQTAGRGRRGRLWLSLPGAAVLFSAHLSMPPMSQAASGLTVAAGVGLWRVLKQYAGVKLKWPNDLLDSRGRKIGGILAEAKGKSVVIGVGINLQLTPQMAAMINKPAAGLADVAGNLPPLAELAQALAGAVKLTCAKFFADGLRSFLPDALRAHYSQIGDAMTISDDAGKNSGGVFAGFADDGALLLKSGGGIVRCLCGEAHNVAGG